MEGIPLPDVKKCLSQEGNFGMRINKCKNAIEQKTQKLWPR